METFRCRWKFIIYIDFDRLDMLRNGGSRSQSVTASVALADENTVSVEPPKAPYPPYRNFQHTFGFKPQHQCSNNDRDRQHQNPSVSNKMSTISVALHRAIPFLCPSRKC